MLEPVTSPAERRAVRLGPLGDLISQAATEYRRSPRLIDRDEYDRARPADAPLSRALVEEFGSWHAACQAALTHRRSEQAGVPAGGRRPWANPTRGRRRPPTYSRAEVLDAVRRTARALDREPVDVSSYAYYSFGSKAAPTRPRAWRRPSALSGSALRRTPLPRRLGRCPRGVEKRVTGRRSAELIRHHPAGGAGARRAMLRPSSSRRRAGRSRS